jgi:hypothetical protein
MRKKKKKMVAIDIFIKYSMRKISFSEQYIREKKVKKKKND